jgi:hypothetical protein
MHSLLYCLAYNVNMARFYTGPQPFQDTPVRDVYDPYVDSGSSGGEVTDLTPERSYDTDIRRLDNDEQAIANRADTRNTEMQQRISKFTKAAKSAAAYKQRRSIDEPTIDGKTPERPVNINPVSPGPFPAYTAIETPSKGDKQGPVGSVNYARKPSISFGRGFG